MTGHAQPPAILKNPGISKASEMLIRLGSVSAFRMISARHDRRSGVHIYFHVLDIHEAGLELRIREVRQKLPSIADFSIPFRIDELVADHACNRSRIADDLGLVPHTLERHQFGGFRGVGCFGSLRERERANQKTADRRLHDAASAPYPHLFEHRLRYDNAGGSLLPWKTPSQHYECHGGR